MLPAAMQWLAFTLFSFLALMGGLGMTTTMSMFRSGIFLMSSFIGVAGLFILLSADLIGLLQIMMYIGGMLVMVMFMVLFMMDPGGSMMAGMKMSPVERFFSAGLKLRTNGMKGMKMDGDMDMDGMDMDDGGKGSKDMDGKDGDSEDGGSHGSDMDMGDMGGMDMSMTTPARPWGLWLGGAVAVLLVLALLLRPAWATAGAGTLDPDAPRQVGELLMSRYMIGFEGAGLLILLGITGAVFIQRPGHHPSDPSRGSFVSADGPPVPIQVEHPLPGEAREPQPEMSSMGQR